MPLWKFECKEDWYHGMWRRWYKNQCVAVGYPPYCGYHLEGDGPNSGWSYTRNRLMEMEIDDDIVVALPYNRVGRIGKITRMNFGDNDWDPLVPPGPGYGGEMGRRVQVRWDLTVGPDNPDLVVQLPEECHFVGNERLRAIAPIHAIAQAELAGVMNNPKNWVSLLGKFVYEKALSDYIAHYSHHLEDGLLPHPNVAIREHRFADGKRADVVLIDPLNNPVIVECKQHAPSVQDIEQLRGYMAQFQEETEQVPRGILVHGGAQNLSDDVENNANLDPVVKVVSYTLRVDFKT